MFYKCIVWHHNSTVASYIRDYRVIRESIWVVNRVKCFSNSSKQFKANKEGEEADVGDVTEVTADSGNDTSVFCSFGCFMSCNTALSSTLEWPLRSDTISYTLLIILGLFSQPQRHWIKYDLWQLYTLPRWLSLQSPGFLLMEMVKASFFTTLNHFPPQKLICCVTSPIFACPRHDLGSFGISSVCIDVMQMACWRYFIYVYVLSGCLFTKITN